MTIDLLLFVVLAGIAIGSALGMLLSRSAVYAALFLVINFGTVAVFYILLNAPFIALTQVSVYAGAIMVLFLFVVMMLNMSPQAVQEQRSWLAAANWIGPVVLAVILLAELVYALASGLPRPPAAQVIEPKQVGMALYGPYLLGVELASVLLLAAMIGAIVIARDDKR